MAEKRPDFDYLELVCSIDTLSICVDERPDSLIRGVSENKRNNSETISLKINPNTYMGYDIHSYKEYLETMRKILQEMEIEKFWYTRVDFRFDSYTSSYEETEKINRALILCYWFKHPSRNLYETKHAWTRQRMSCCLKDNNAELESYNKAFQEPSGTVLSRFEVRTKSKTRTLDTFPLDARPRAYIKAWQRELKDCATLLDDMVQAQNEVLMQEYSEGKAKHLYSSPMDFARHNVDYIFTAKQLDDLFAQMGVKNPTTARYNFAKRYSNGETLFFKQKDLIAYSKHLSKKMGAFLVASD